MLYRKFLLLLLIIGACPFVVNAQSNYVTSDFFVPNGGLQLQVRKVVEKTYSPSRKIPLLLVHGGTGALTSFDLDVEDASFARALSDVGFAVYLMNVRGWERSTAPVYATNDTSLVAGSCQEAASDIGAVVDFIGKDFPGAKINLFGWATGGHWASYYATLHADKIAHLIVLNSLYGVKAPWQLSSAFASTGDPEQFNATIPLMRQSDERAMLNTWKNEIPTDTTFEADSAVIKTFARTAVSFNDEHVMRTPGGFRKESFYMARGRKYWDAKDITVPTLVIRAENDFWSRPIDLDTYYNDLQNAPIRKKVIIPAAGHFVFLDRNGNGRRRLLLAINNFVKKGL